jgi:ATP-dependent helicase/DNAse subunit B
MSKSNLSKEAETRLMTFFSNTVAPEQMAKAIRQVNFVLALGLIRENETLQQEIIKLENSFYWLNELAEILNPYLDVE